MKKIKFTPRLLLLAALLAFMLVFPQIFNRPYLLAIMITTFYIGCASLAWSILGGMIGQVSLGHAAFMGLGAYISTVLLQKLHLSPWLSMIVVFFVVGALIALLMIPCFGLKGAYFSLATIAFGEMFINLFTNWAFVGGGQGLMLGIGKDSFWMLRFKSKVPYYYVALGMLIAFYIIVRRIDRSKLGYAFKTIREDEGTANAIGINPQRYKTIATFLSAGMVAVVGVFYANYIRYINTDIMSQAESLSFVLPAVIGGVSTVEGPILGALIIVPISQYLSSTLGSVLPGANLVVYACILIGVILFQPAGLLGWFYHSALKKKIDAKMGVKTADAHTETESKAEKE